MNGYSLVPAGDDIVKVIGTGRSPRNAGIPLISDEADIPDGEHVISFSSSCTTPIRSSCSRLLGNISRRRSLTRRSCLAEIGQHPHHGNSSVIRSLIRIVDQIERAAGAGGERISSSSSAPTRARWWKC